MLPHWHSAHPAFLRRFPRRQAYWLSLPGSLTRALRKAYADFEVKLLFEGMKPASLDQYRQLGIKPGRWLWTREVELWGNHQPRVFAQTQIPLSTLIGRHRQLRYLANRPLGAYLFGAGRAKRSQLQILSEPMPRTGLTCGRRSVFLLPRPLLVAEYFFDSLT